MIAKINKPEAKARAAADLVSIVREMLDDLPITPRTVGDAHAARNILGLSVAQAAKAAHVTPEIWLAWEKCSPVMPLRMWESLKKNGAALVAGKEIHIFGERTPRPRLRFPPPSASV